MIIKDSRDIKKSFIVKEGKMRYKVSRIIVLCLLLIFGLVALYGCAGTMQAIEHRQMSMSAKMSDTIFLDPETLAKNRIVYVRVTNTSDFQEIDFGEILKAKLSSKGFQVTNDPSKAGYIVQANLLYMGQEKEGLTGDGMLAGGFGGALAGSALGGDWKGSVAGGLAGAAVGSVVGGLVGSMIHVDTYLGVSNNQFEAKNNNCVTMVTIINTEKEQTSLINLRTILIALLMLLSSHMTA